MSTTVTLYCKNNVAHWLHSQYGNPVKLPRRSAFKYSFLSALSKKFHPSREYDTETYPCAVNFQLHINDQVQHGLSIQKQLHNFINRTIEEEMKNQLFLYIHAHSIKGVTIDKAVLLYQAQFGFSDSVFSSDAIRRAYFRRKEELEKIFCGTVTLKN